MCCSGVLITGQDWRSYENEVLMKVLDLLAFTRVGTEYNVQISNRENCCLDQGPYVMREPNPSGKIINETPNFDNLRMLATAKQKFMCKKPVGRKKNPIFL